jgi:hypothetical protein
MAELPNTPLTQDLEDLYPDEMTIEPYTGEDEYGSSGYGIPYIVKAQITGKVRTVIDRGGQETVSMQQAMICGVFGINREDRFTLPPRFSTNPTDPDDLTGRQPKAISVLTQEDENGTAYEKVLF